MTGLTPSGERKGLDAATTPRFAGEAKLRALAEKMWAREEFDDMEARAILQQLDGCRRLLYEVIREVPVSSASPYEHHDRQKLHRRVISWLDEEWPETEFVPPDYWLGRTP